MHWTSAIDLLKAIQAADGTPIMEGMTYLACAGDGGSLLRLECRVECTPDVKKLVQKVLHASGISRIVIVAPRLAQAFVGPPRVADEFQADRVRQIRTIPLF